MLGVVWVDGVPGPLNVSGLCDGPVESCELVNLVDLWILDYSLYEPY